MSVNPRTKKLSAVIEKEKMRFSYMGRVQLERRVGAVSDPWKIMAFFVMCKLKGYERLAGYLREKGKASGCWDEEAIGVLSARMMMDDEIGGR